MLEAITHCITWGKSSARREFSADDYVPNIPEVIPVEIPEAEAKEEKPDTHGHCHGDAENPEQEEINQLINIENLDEEQRLELLNGPGGDGSLIMPM